MRSPWAHASAVSLSGRLWQSFGKFPFGTTVALSFSNTIYSAAHSCWGLGCFVCLSGTDIKCTFFSSRVLSPVSTLVTNLAIWLWLVIENMTLATHSLTIWLWQHPWPIGFGSILTVHVNFAQRQWCDDWYGDFQRLLFSRPTTTQMPNFFHWHPLCRFHDWCCSRMFSLTFDCNDLIYCSAAWTHSLPHELASHWCEGPIDSGNVRIATFVGVLVSIRFWLHPTLLLTCSFRDWLHPYPPGCSPVPDNFSTNLHMATFCDVGYIRLVGNLVSSDFVSPQFLSTLVTSLTWIIDTIHVSTFLFRC